MIRRDVLQRVDGKVAFIALALEEVATALDDEDLPPENRKLIDGALRRGQREVEILQKGLASILSELEL